MYYCWHIVVLPGATTVQIGRMLCLPHRETDLLDVPSSVSKPVIELTLRHVGIASQIVLLGLRRVRVLVMRLQPLDKNGVVAFDLLWLCWGQSHQRIGAVRSFFIAKSSLIVGHDRRIDCNLNWCCNRAPLVLVSEAAAAMESMFYIINIIVAHARRFICIQLCVRML